MLDPVPLDGSDKNLNVPELREKNVAMSHKSSLVIAGWSGTEGDSWKVSIGAASINVPQIVLSRIAVEDFLLAENNFHFIYFWKGAVGLRLNAIIAYLT